MLGVIVLDYAIDAATVRSLRGRTLVSAGIVAGAEAILGWLNGATVSRLDGGALVLDEAAGQRPSRRRAALSWSGRSGSLQLEMREAGVVVERAEYLDVVLDVPLSDRELSP